MTYPLPAYTPYHQIALLQQKAVMYRPCEAATPPRMEVSMRLTWKAMRDALAEILDAPHIALNVHTVDAINARLRRQWEIGEVERIEALPPFECSPADEKLHTELVARIRGTA